MKPYVMYLMAAVFALSAVFTACKKKEESSNGGDNQPPTCTITNPKNNTEIGMDKNISVTVDAEDDDGKVVEVQLFLDDVGHSVKTEFPYHFTIEAGTLQVGSHTLKAVAKDDQNAKTEATVAIIITQSGENKAPTCTITNPQNNAEYSTDENVPITVVAEDTDGYIVEIQLYVDNVGHSSTTSFPYNFTINSGELSVGTHTLRAVAKDNAGGNGESTVTITIKQPTESPDFVSFSNGNIPSTWQTTAWYVDNSVGYDDNYSLKASVANVAVITSKTATSAISGIEFYVRSGSVTFFIDGEKMLECSSDNNWKKYSVFLTEGLHTLKWESSSNSVNIDAIRFKKMNYFVVGMPYQGGIIAYVDDSGEHGLIAAPYDQSEGIQWYNGSNINTGAIGTAMGAGKNNTEKIVQAQGAGNYAAKICDDLTIDGYSDWFLPSKDELHELYKNRDKIGGFDVSLDYLYYWSSSEDSNDTAWCQDFSDGNQYHGTKRSTFRVRAVRAF